MSFFTVNSLQNSSIEIKNAARIFAFSWPMCLMPIEKINFSRLIIFDLVIAFFKFSIDNFPHPSSFSIFG